MKGLFILGNQPLIYDEQTTGKIKELVDIYAPPLTAAEVLEHPEALKECEIIFSGWGAPRMDEEFLANAPNLKIVFYGAGSVRCFVTDAFWQRGIRCVSAWAANAVPVSEYTLGAILLCLKGLFVNGTRYMRSEGGERVSILPAGGYGSRVGLVSTGMIGSRVAQLLKPFEVEVVAYDPFLTEEEAKSLGVKRVTLEELFRTSDVVSIHTPLLPQTVGMITGEHLSSMKQGASLINTSRGAVIREAEMVAVLQSRPDLFALLDVTNPEPPEKGSALYHLPNVLLTPHIAGSMGAECARHGKTMLEELRRFLNGQPLQWEITEKRAKTLA